MPILSKTTGLETKSVRNVGWWLEIGEFGRDIIIDQYIGIFVFIIY
jgi:hypothetical protein